MEKSDLLNMVKAGFIYSLSFLIVSGAFGQNGPGGVSDTDGALALVLWLDANTIGQSNNTEVTSWADISGYGNDATAPGGTGPHF